jgi:regulatory protein
MNFITAITPVPRHPGRFDVQVNGKSLAILSLDAIERLRLTVGVGVAGREEQIAEEAAALKVYDRALDMLAFRGRSSVELARSLVRKGEPKVLVDRAVDRLLEQGLLDDAAFAESFTRAKVLGAQHSRRRVQQDLARKGVGRELSAVAIARVFDEEGVDQRAVVEQAARKKLRSLTKLDPAVRRRRLYAFLARRGFDSDDIRRVMDGLGQALRGGEDGEE